MEDSIPRSIIILIFILLGGFFAAAEAALEKCSRARVKKLADDGEKRAVRLNRTLELGDKAEFTVKAVKSAAYVCALVLAALLPVWRYGAAGAAVSAAVAAVLIFVLDEILIKSLARSGGDKVAYFFARPIFALSVILTPLTLALRGIAAASGWLTPGHGDAPSMTEDEFQTIIENIEDEGLILPEESELIQSAIEFSDTAVSEIMTPVTKMVGVEIGDSEENVRALVLSEKYSRIPVYAGSPDRVVGVLQTRECLVNIMNGREIDVSAAMKLPYCVPPTTRLDELFEGLGHRRTHFAVITGDDGRALGFLTMEDIMEELVGEIYDEDDEEVDSALAKEAGQ